MPGFAGCTIQFVGMPMCIALRLLNVTLVPAPNLSPFAICLSAPDAGQLKSLLM